MRFSELTIEEIVARHRKGEKVIITGAATFPSDIFPVGTFHTVRFYTGRSETEWGSLIGEVNAEVTETGLQIPSYDLKNVVNPATGKVKRTLLSYWIVRPDGIEQYTGDQAEVLPDGSPYLESLLTKHDYIN
jgi:hypothetical protein